MYHRTSESILPILPVRCMVYFIWIIEICLNKQKVKQIKKRGGYLSEVFVVALSAEGEINKYRKTQLPIFT